MLPLSALLARVARLLHQEIACACIYVRSAPRCGGKRSQEAEELGRHIRGGARRHFIVDLLRQDLCCWKIRSDRGYIGKGSDVLVVPHRQARLHPPILQHSATCRRLRQPLVCFGVPRTGAFLAGSTDGSHLTAGASVCCSPGEYAAPGDTVCTRCPAGKSLPSNPPPRAPPRRAPMPRPCSPDALPARRYMRPAFAPVAAHVRASDVFKHTFKRGKYVKSADMKALQRGCLPSAHGVYREP